MERTVAIHLNSFPRTPRSLRATPRVNVPVPTTSVDLGSLYHHYYLDSYGCNPPNPDPAHFEYLETLAAGQDLIFRDRGPGSNPSKRRNISSELGQAFFRWFCHEHLGMTYFAHLAHVLGRTTHPGFKGLQVKRVVQSGDTPDYLCARRFERPIIGEAKGRYRAISFGNKEFQGWRDQMARVALYSPDGSPIALKGYIVATRYATENNRLPMSQIYAEDPETPGEAWREDAPPMWRGIAAIHYSLLFSRLGLTILSDALLQGFSVAPEIRFRIAIWRCLAEPLVGRVFAGGVFSQGKIPFTEESESLYFRPSILQLGQPSPTFFGVELKNFTAALGASRGNWEALDGLEDLQANPIDGRPSNLTWTRDGAILGPLEYFACVDSREF